MREDKYIHMQEIQVATPRLQSKLVMNSAFLLSITLVFIFAACSEQIATDPDEIPQSAGSCLGCHTNYAVLKRVASPDTAAVGGGCGGDTPHIEPYDRVYIGGPGAERFRSSTHFKQGCVSCHNGQDDTPDKSKAHGGDFIAHPSEYATVKCSPCHANIAHNFYNSIHMGGWGQKNMVVTRSGFVSFEQLPDGLKGGYKQNCQKCHASCGDCHVNRPKAGGGGLYKGHDFRRTPDMVDNCIACHTSRGGHAYLGIAAGTVPDIHLTKLGNGHCLSCHSKTELHGNGQVYDQRYKVPMLPRCDNCHGNLASSNPYHAVHLGTFNCQTCHSQNYNNCGSCHVGGDGARIPSYQDFKIGINPIPETRPFRYATVRRSLMAPDSWQKYGIATLTNFDAKPTFKYTTPHNIIRWTTRTKVAAGKTCSDNCHIIKEGNTLRNRQLYLFNSDLQPWERIATKNVVVDGKLPATWGVQ